MPGKLPIRRKGGCLPVLCLVGFVFFVGVYAILCQKGLPDCALREIEKRAAAEGVSLSIGKIRLAPAKFALRADDVHVEIPLNEELPPAALDIRKIKVDFPLLKLISGKQRPAALHLPEFSINIPVSEDKAAQPLQLSNFSAVLTWENEDRDLRLRTRGNLNDIDLDVQVACSEADPLTPLAELANDFDEVAAAFATGDTEEETTTEAENAAAQLPALLNSIRDTIAAQQWTEGNRPTLKIDLNLLPASPVISVSGHIPTYELSACHLRNMAVEAEYRDKTLTINQADFSTIGPDATLTLQGGFDFNQRELNLQLKGNAALAQLTTAIMREKTPKVVTNARVGNDNLPQIDLNGYVVFSNGYAINHIRNYQISGSIRQKGLQLRREAGENDNAPETSCINELNISFMLHDGGISIRPIQIKLPGGELKAQVSVKDGADSGSGSLSVHAPADEVIRLLLNAELLTEEDARNMEFRPEGMIHLDLNTEMTLPLFVPGKTELSDLIPVFSQVEIDSSLDSLKTPLGHISKPALSLTLTKPSFSKESCRAKTLTAKLSAEQIHLALEQFSAQEDHFDLNLKLTDIESRNRRLSIDDSLLEVSLKHHAAEWREENQETQTASADDLSLRVSLLGADIPLERIATQTAPATVDTAELQFTCSHSAMGEQELNGLEFSSENLRYLRFEPTLAAIPAAGAINLKVADLRLAEDAALSDAALRLWHADGAPNSLSLSIVGHLNERELNCHGDVSVWESTANDTPERQGYTIELSDFSTKLPVHAVGQLPGLQFLNIPEVRLPQEAELSVQSGKVELYQGEAPEITLNDISLRIPELTRCPQLPVLQGQDVTVGVDISQASLRVEKSGHISYAGDATVTHKDKSLAVHFVGDTEEQVKVTGTSTITADVYDRLIDNEDAHFIIRDFRFTPGVSEVTASDIVTTVNWHNGLSIDVSCNADIRDTEYLLMSMDDEEDAEGHLLRETLRKDLGANPYTLFKHATCGVKVRIGIDRDGLPDEQLIILSDPVLVYNNRPWLSRAGIRNGAKESTINGKEVKFDIEACTLTLTDIEGTAYPAYAFGTFYPDLYVFMKDVHLQQPAEVSTHSCVFPIAHSCQVPMSGTIRARSKQGASYSIIGTDIPLEHFSGYITLSDTAVYLSRLNAMSWEGALDADINIGFAKGKTSFNGRVRADAVNVALVANSYGVDLAHGLGEGQILFASPSAELNDLKAHGRIAIRDGDLMRLGVFESVRDLITNLPSYVLMLEKADKPESDRALQQKEKGPFSWLFSYVFTDVPSQIPFTNYLLSYGLSNAFADFRINRGKLSVEDAKITGTNLQLRADAVLDLDTIHIEQGHIRPTIFGVSTQLLRAFTALSAHHIITIDLNGPLDNLKWKTRFLTGENSDTPALHSEESPDRKSE